MTQTATVRRIISTRKAEVAVSRGAACGHKCGSCGGCKGGGQAEVLAVAENEVGAREGDVVVVESASSRVLGIALVVYLVPFVLFFGVYLLCGGMGLTEPASIGLAVVGFLAGAAFDLLLNRRLKHERKAALHIVSVRQGNGVCSDM